MTLQINTIIQGDALEVLKTLPDESVDAVITDPPYGLKFMGKHWDYDVPSIEIWQECLRVLKPGGYLLSFAGTRTQHRMACRIEDAGFEIRDMIAWVYGSGFPKSLNVGKAVDKLQGNEREDLGKHPNSRETLGNIQICKKNGKGRLTKGTPDWEGWGTALKPALEPITVARKPLSEKTVAENVLKWGTGGINIDACGVGTEDNLNGGAYSTSEDGMSQNEIFGKYYKKPGQYQQPSGRWPANFIHDGSDEVLGLFPQSKGCQPHRITSKNKKYQGWGTITNKQGEMIGYSGLGSAARFFYCAKASKAERNAGCEGLEEKVGGSMMANSGDTMQLGGASLKGEPKQKIPDRNHHPTVKPIALMEYLIKLVSRDGALVLDPYCGSGTTAIACHNLNRNYICIENEEEFVVIAEARVKEARRGQLALFGVKK